jgi:hypothetical protein
MSADERARRPPPAPGGPGDREAEQQGEREQRDARAAEPGRAHRVVRPHVIAGGDQNDEARGSDRTMQRRHRRMRAPRRRSAQIKECEAKPEQRRSAQNAKCKLDHGSRSRRVNWLQSLAQHLA